MEFKTIESKRLILRAFRPEDYKDLYEYLSDENVVKYEPYCVFSLEECKEEAIYRSNNPTFFAVCLKSNQKVIGNIYLNKCSPEHVDTYEIGYVFNRSFGGKGYATESAQAVLDYGFKILNAHRFIAKCNVENLASWKLLERLKMRREATRIKNMFFDRDSNGNPIWFDSYQYAILKDEWESIYKN